MRITFVRWVHEDNFRKMHTRKLKVTIGQITFAQFLMFCCTSHHVQKLYQETRTLEHFCLLNIIVANRLV